MSLLQCGKETRTRHANYDPPQDLLDATSLKSVLQPWNRRDRRTFVPATRILQSRIPIVIRYKGRLGQRDLMTLG